MGVQSHRLSTEKGDGSRTAIEDEKTGDKWESKDARSDTHTTFFESDIDRMVVSERRKQELKRALRRQEGENPGEAYSQSRNDRKQQNRSEWKRRLVTTFAAQLDLTSYQKQRSLHLIQDVLDINSFGWYSTEEVILGTINCVAREDGRWIEDEHRFRVLMEDVGIEAGEIKSIRLLVRDRLK